MMYRLEIHLLLIMIFVLPACVSKDKYTQMESGLNAQLKKRSDDLSSLQNRYTRLEAERDELLKRIDGLKLDLAQARDDIRIKSTMIEELTLNLGKSQSIIRQRDMAITGLQRDLGLTRALVREKENKISELDSTRIEIESNLREQIAEKDIK
ncbi:MAG: hypothetical protein GTO40_02175, partial [Deltaproteobacteria bacterium]|nr:hypothetical protein [Deltaproteobacteria bacterium]